MHCGVGIKPKLVKAALQRLTFRYRKKTPADTLALSFGCDRDVIQQQVTGLRQYYEDAGKTARVFKHTHAAFRHPRSIVVQHRSRRLADFIDVFGIGRPDNLLDRRHINRCRHADRLAAHLAPAHLRLLLVDPTRLMTRAGGSSSGRRRFWVGRRGWPLRLARCPSPGCLARRCAHFRIAEAR